MAALCGDRPRGPDGVSLTMDESRYQSDAIVSLKRTVRILTYALFFLSAAAVVLIALVAWLGVNVRSAKKHFHDSNLDFLAMNATVTTLVGVLNNAQYPSMRANVTMLMATASTLQPQVYLSKGKPTVPGYTAYGSLFRGSGAWAVQTDATPWGGLSDHLVLTNTTNLLPTGSNSVIILGGMNNNSDFVKAVYAYNAMYETYSSLPDMPVVRSRFSAAIGGSSIYVVGGYAGPTTLNDDQSQSTNQSASMDVYNFNTRKWTANVAQLKTNRSDACSVFIGSKLYVIGGYDTAYNILASVEVYDTANPAAGFAAFTPIPAPRGDVGCNSVGTQIFVHGGYYDPSGQFLGGFHQNTTWALDVAQPSLGWVRKADMNNARGDHAFTILSNGRLLVMGGENDILNTLNKTPIRSVELYNIADDTWSEKAPMVYARFRFSAGVVTSPTVGDSTVYAFNGHNLCLDGTSCASKAANTLSVYSNLQHPDVFVMLNSTVIQMQGAGTD